MFIIHVLGISEDCPTLISLGNSLKMGITNAGIMTQLNTNCCSATGVICTASGNPKVSALYWNNLGLTGTFRNTIFANMTSLTTIRFTGNSITGSLPIDLPQSVLEVSMGSNRLNGTIPSTWPNALTSLSVYTNLLTGQIPTTLPASLTFLNVGTNQLSGSIPVLPLNLLVLRADNNRFSGSLPSLWPIGLTDLIIYSNSIIGPLPSTFPSSMTSLNVGSNQLNGTIPTLPSNLSLLHLDRGSFSGLLPADFPRNVISLRLGRNAGLYGDVTNIITANVQYLWLGDKLGNYGTAFTGSLTIAKPIELFIDSNSITDIQVADTSSLSGSCDISYNPLLSNPNISNLASCIKNGLFTLSTAQIAISTSLIVKKAIQTSTIPLTNDLAVVDSTTFIDITGLSSDTVSSSPTFTSTESIQSTSSLT